MQRVFQTSLEDQYGRILGSCRPLIEKGSIKGASREKLLVRLSELESLAGKKPVRKILEKLFPSLRGRPADTDLAIFLRNQAYIFRNTINIENHKALMQLAFDHKEMILKETSQRYAETFGLDDPESALEAHANFEVHFKRKYEELMSKAELVALSYDNLNEEHTRSELLQSLKDLWFLTEKLMNPRSLWGTCRKCHQPLLMPLRRGIHHKYCFQHVPMCTDE